MKSNWIGQMSPLKLTISNSNNFGNPKGHVKTCENFVNHVVSIKWNEYGLDGGFDGSKKTYVDERGKKWNFHKNHQNLDLITIHWEGWKGQKSA